MKTDKELILMARELALRSVNPWLVEVGAVIVDENREVLATGYNQLPSGVVKRDRGYIELTDEHAERVAIFEAARRGVRLDAATLYLSCVFHRHDGTEFIGGWPCPQCARAIIMSGIREVVSRAEIKPPFWQPNLTLHFEMMREAGVRLVRLDQDFNRMP